MPNQASEKTKGKLLAYSKKCDVEYSIIGKQMSKITKKSLQAHGKGQRQ